jgi:hypothetical protein
MLGTEAIVSFLYISTQFICIPMKPLYAFFIVFLPTLAWTQSWLYEAPVKPAGSGYQDIYLPPAVTCRLAPEAGNIRLQDTTGNELPYIISETKLVEEEASIVWMSHYEDDYWAHWYSRSYFQNPKQLKLDRLALKIRNADVHQRFWLSGSDDMSRWYIIKEDYGYDANYDPNSTWNLLTIHFPLTDYKYYKVELRHYWEEPIQIMGAGYYAYAEKQGNSQRIPDPVITQHEEGTQSIVEIHFDGPHYLDQMVFEVDGPELYLRNASLLRQNEGGGFDAFKQLQLSSKSLNQLALDRARGETWRLVIENKDDKPIRIAGVQARQRQQYLTAKLDPKMSYKVLVGEEHLRAPEYDLAFFKNDLPKTRSAASVGNVINLLKPVVPSAPMASADSTSSKPQATISAPEKPLYQRPVFLWVGIGAIVLLVGGMSIKLLKEMKSNGQ